MVIIKCQEQGLAVAKIALGLPLSDSDSAWSAVPPYGQPSEQKKTTAKDKGKINGKIKEQGKTRYFMSVNKQP